MKESTKNLKVKRKQKYIDDSIFKHIFARGSHLPIIWMLKRFH